MLGRFVRYVPGTDDERYSGSDPMPALVTKAINDQIVNLCVFTPDGGTEARQNVTHKDHVATLEKGSYSHWVTGDWAGAARVSQNEGE